jgi:hypothetical protein
VHRQLADQQTERATALDERERQLRAREQELAQREAMLRLEAPAPSAAPPKTMDRPRKSSGSVRTCSPSFLSSHNKEKINKSLMICIASHTSSIS